MSPTESFGLTRNIQMALSIAFGAVLRRAYFLHGPGVTLWYCNRCTDYL